MKMRTCNGGLMTSKKLAWSTLIWPKNVLLAIKKSECNSWIERFNLSNASKSFATKQKNHSISLFFVDCRKCLLGLKTKGLFEIRHILKTVPKVSAICAQTNSVQIIVNYKCSNHFSFDFFFRSQNKKKIFYTLKEYIMKCVG